MGSAVLFRHTMRELKFMDHAHLNAGSIVPISRSGVGGQGELEFSAPLLASHFQEVSDDRPDQILSSDLTGF